MQLKKILCLPLWNSFPVKCFNFEYLLCILTGRLENISIHILRTFGRVKEPNNLSVQVKVIRIKTKQKQINTYSIHMLIPVK